jgi:hypothetical protein
MKELKTVQTLITETRGDIARGYRLEQSRPNVGVNLCLGGMSSHVGLSLCSGSGATTHPVAIDRATEERKLAALEKRRADLLKTLAARNPACAAPSAG